MNPSLNTVHQTSVPETRPRESGTPPNATDLAARLISETAHDLRSPLTTIREAIRLVSDGELGDINADQKSYLASAIDQCDCVDQMVYEMVQMERLRTGVPRVRRRWVPVTDVRQSVDQTLRPWALPREISLRWDGADDPTMTVFADPSMLRRLIVNLVVNSIRVTAEGESVRIRLQRVRDGEAIRWSVVDRGSGIDETDIGRIAQRQVTTSEGQGLGLSICRQLAALHSSTLQIRSRAGSGTEVSLETAAAGPSSVAECWARWRFAQLESRKRSENRHRDLVDPGVQTTHGPRPSRRVRLDPPAVSIDLASDGSQPRCPDQVSAGVVTLGAAVPRQAAESFDELLQNQLRMFELVYRVDTRQWVWVFDQAASDIGGRIAAIGDMAHSQIPTTRLSWSEPKSIPIEERRTAARLSDLLIRRTLSSSVMINVTDNNQVQLGTAPIAPSTIATMRLDKELRHLAGRLTRQTSLPRQQVKNLRPNE